MTPTVDRPSFAIEISELALPLPTGSGPGHRQALGLFIWTTGSGGDTGNRAPDASTLVWRTKPLTTTSIARAITTASTDRRRGC